MISFGFWNVLIVIVVALVLKNNWRLDNEKTVWKNSLFLKSFVIQRLIQFFRQPIVNFLVQVGVVLVVTRFLCYTGWLVYLLNQPDPPLWDFKWFYVASKLAHQHLSPFNVETFNQSFCTLTKVCGFIPPFVYPPNIIPLIWFLGYFSSNTAFTIWIGMHILAIGLALWGANILLESKSLALRTICTISVALIYGLVRDLQVGNIAIFVAVLILWMFILAKKHQDIPAGICLGLAVCKPTLAALFILYFLLKRRFSLVFVSAIAGTSLVFLGLALTGTSLTQFLPDAARGFSLWLNDPSNSPYLSISRLDLMVVGPRLFPNNPFFAKLFSDLIVLILVGLVGWYWYLQQSLTGWSKKIYLAEIVLVSCLSIAINYSQQTSSVMLIPAVVFLLNDLLYQIRHCKFSRTRMSIWLAGVCCLAVQTGVIHGWLIGSLANRWNVKAGELPYIMKVTIFALPSYAILGITVSILVLAISSLHQKQVLKFESLNRVSTYR
ncbi:MAG: glycosyltransferase family 87 protein [Nostoc sp. ChiQUE02]|uniref:glycosyltransferase family 87 protein n=1 Tax=Nostoc sp. ChiQUE02 TaxID=3075377 RepID=UPI002AD2D0A4|nr:glycosyltransferase family 87 protein [Nostoc sp. ChiQUE02]MDZ8233667.1 glycosyltransferase family 87 protein [Nostoc sp. ChiQUE02]